MPRSSEQATIGSPLVGVGDHRFRRRRAMRRSLAQATSDAPVSGDDRALTARCRRGGSLLGDDVDDRDPDGYAGAADFELVVALEELADSGGLHESVGARDEDAAARGDLGADFARDDALADGGEADAVDGAAGFGGGGVGADADAHHARDRGVGPGRGVFG